LEHVSPVKLHTSIFAVAYNLHVVASTPLVQCNKKSLLLAPPEWLDRVTFDPFVWRMIGGYPCYMDVEPKIGGKKTKMDGENNGKPMIWGENPLFPETPI